MKVFIQNDTLWQKMDVRRADHKSNHAILI